MENNILVSALVSTYNSEKFIRGCLEDLVGQTLYKREKLEIIVINSGSGQNEDKIVREFQEKYRYITYIHTDERENTSRAFNRGIKIASGKYLTMANTDDRHRRDALEIMAEELENNPGTGLIYSDSFVTNFENQTFDAHIRCGYLIRPDYKPEIMLTGCHMGPQAMWLKSAHEKAGYFNEKILAANDYDLWCRIATYYPLKHIKEFLGLYYENPVGSFNTNKIQGIEETTFIKKFYKDCFPPPLSCDYINNYQYTDYVPQNKYVNICIITYNRLSYTGQTIEHILKFTRYPHVITVVDNGSSDGSKEYLKELKEKGIIKNLILLDENVGVAKASNLARYMEPEALYYLKLDNDILIKKYDWLDNMIKVVEAVPAIGALAYNFETRSYPASAINNHIIRIKTDGNLGGACILIPKHTEKLLGYWCEDYGLYGEEDSDFGVRIQCANLLNVYMDDENIGIHLPSGKAARIDPQTLRACDLGEQKDHEAYRIWKDEQRKINAGKYGLFTRNLLMYKHGLKSIYVDSVFAEEYLNKEKTGNEPLKILHITIFMSDTYRSDERKAIFEYCNILAKSNHRITLVTLKDSYPRWIDLEKNINIINHHSNKEDLLKILPAGELIFATDLETAYIISRIPVIKGVKGYIEVKEKNNNSEPFHPFLPLKTIHIAPLLHKKPDKILADVEKHLYDFIIAALEYEQTGVNHKEHYFVRLFIDNGPGFIEEQSIIKEITDNEEKLEFDVTYYNNIKKLRFIPVNAMTVIQIHDLCIINIENHIYRNLTCHDNAILKKDNVFIFDTDEPLINIDITDIINPQKLIITLKYISFGMDIYKYMLNETVKNIKTRDEQIFRLMEKEKTLNTIYNSRGWKILTRYYRLRDFLLPKHSLRHKIIKSFFNFTAHLKNILTPVKITCDRCIIYNTYIEINGWALSAGGIERMEIYLDDTLLGTTTCGNERPDVEKVFSHIKDSKYSGFQFNRKFYKRYESGSTHTVKIIAGDKKRNRKKLVMTTTITRETIFRNTKDLYEKWLEKYEQQEQNLISQSKITFKYEPEISIITPVYNESEQLLIDMIESVRSQTYSKWELCITYSAGKYINTLLQYYTNKDRRIKVKLLPENKDMATNFNQSLSLATGDFITILDNNDILPPFALFEIVKVINNHSDVDFIYSDEDKISEDGKRFEPHFKPDWSPDTLRSHNYIGHIAVFRKDTIKQAGSFRPGFEGSEDYDLILRSTEKAKKIIHIQKILYHRRYSEGHTETDSHNSTRKALEDHLKRVNIKGKVEKGLLEGTYKITRDIPEYNKISIIIPNKDQYDYLKKCVDSIINKSSYRNFEIIIVENGSTEENIFKYYEELKKKTYIKIIEWHGTFNYAAINNHAVKCSTGENLLFLNNDTEVINSDWLERMLEHVIRKETGAVGAKMYYPDDTIQHGGVIIGLHGAAMHGHRHFHKDEPGYNSRLMVVQNLSAVTAACLMMRKDAFLEIGGFDERYSIAFNDVDLCLKLREKNYLIVWTPYAELYHYESVTRGLDDTPEKQEIAKKEVELLKSRWKEIFQQGDPYYNRNLTLDKEDFSLKYA